MDTLQTVDVKQKFATKKVKGMEVEVKGGIVALDKEMKSLLNSFQIDQINTFVNRFKELVTDLEKFHVAMALIFEKAVDDLIFAGVCGRLCQVQTVDD